MKNSRNYYYTVLMVIFLFSTPVIAQQKTITGPSVTNKQAKEELKGARKREKEKKKANKAVKKHTKKEMEKENVKPRYKGIFRKRKKEAKKLQNETEAKQ